MRRDQHVLLVVKGGDLIGQRVYLAVELLDVRARGRKRLDVGVERVETRQQLVALRLELAELLVLTLEALGFFGGCGHAGAQVALLRREVRDGVLDAGGARGVLGEALLHGGQRMRGRRAGARPCGEQLRRDVGGVAQRPQLVAREREHRLERFLVDVGHKGSIALQAVAVADAG